MKKILKLTALILLLVISFSCEKQDEQINEESISNIEIEKTEKSTPNDANNRLVSCRFDDEDIVKCPSESYALSIATDIVNPIYTWSIISGNISSTIVGQGTASATFTNLSNFIGGTIKIVITSSTDPIDSCTFAKDILLCNGSGDDGNDGETCRCPTPSIEDVVCVSGGHPDWRFDINGISASDNVTWAINHGTVINGVNSPYYAIIRPNPGSTAGFTVSCTVTRICPNGLEKTVTAYYTNYYGNDCGTGTTWSSSCTIIGGSGGLDVEPAP